MAGLKVASFRFKPFSRKQKKILTWWLPESGVSDYNGIIADGAIRSGKTVCMGLSFTAWAMETFSEQNFAICGKTIGSVRKNVIGPLKQMLYTRGYKVNDRRADQMLEVRKNGKTNYFYLYGGKDERSQDLIQGITLAGILLDEVALMPASFVSQATARCSVEGSKMWFNCNPGSPMHPFKTEFLDRCETLRLLHIHFELDDNLSLSEEKKNQYRVQYQGVFFKRYILGLWCAAEGIIYGMYDDAKEPRFSDIGREYALSIDYGTLNAFAAGLWAYDGKVWHMTDEYYYSGRETGRQKTDDQYVKDMEKFITEKIPKEAWTRIEQDGGIMTIVDPSAASFITALRQRSSKFRVRPADNAVLDGIRDTATCIQEGRIKIADSCNRTFAEFAGYVWDDDPAEDKPVKVNDHCLTGETLVDTVMMGQIKIKDLVGKFGLVWSINKRGNRCIRPFFGVRLTQKNRPIMRITLENGKTVDCTPEHRILTDSGWKEAKYLSESDKVVDISDGVSCVAKMQDIGCEGVYNMEVLGTHCFSVNGGVIVHNCMDQIRYLVRTKRIVKPETEYHSVFG